MQVHLVDATYELFRAHFAPRPPVLGKDGILLSGVSGLVEQLLFLLREQGATHVGLRHGPRDPLVPQRPLRRLQDRGRDAPRAPGPVPDRRAGHRGPGARPVADGRVRGRRRDRRRGRAVRGGPAGRAGRDLHARQGHGPVRPRRADRALGPAPRHRLRRRRACARSGACRPRASPTGWPSSATRRTAIPGCRAGATSRRRPCSRGTATSRRSRPTAATWDVPGLRNPVGLATTLRERLGRRAPLSRPRATADDRRRRADPAGDRG